MFTLLFIVGVDNNLMFIFNCFYSIVNLNGSRQNTYTNKLLDIRYNPNYQHTNNVNYQQDYKCSCKTFKFTLNTNFVHQVLRWSGF